jgi:hypothetical protein
MAAAGSEVVLTLEDEAGTGLREVAVRRAPVSSLAALADCFKLIADLKHKARPRAAAAAARGGARRRAARRGVASLDAACVRRSCGWLRRRSLSHGS